MSGVFSMSPDKKKQLNQAGINLITKGTCVCVCVKVMDGEVTVGTQ